MLKFCDSRIDFISSLDSALVTGASIYFSKALLGRYADYGRCGCSKTLVFSITYSKFTYLREELQICETEQQIRAFCAWALC